MAYKIATEYNGGPNGSKDPKGAISLVLTVERENMKFPKITYQLLSLLKIMTLIFGGLLALLNRHKILDTLGKYEYQVLSTAGTILQKDFTSQRHF